MKPFRYIKELRADASEPENMRLLLVLYWRVLLGFVLALMLCVFAYGGWQLYGVMNDGSDTQSNAPDTVSNIPLSGEQIDAVLQGFTARQVRFESLQASTTMLIADPAQ